MATCFTVHAQTLKSHNLKAIKRPTSSKILIFAMTAVSKTSNYATANHYDAIQLGRVIQVVVSTLHTPMGLSPQQVTPSKFCLEHARWP